MLSLSRALTELVIERLVIALALLDPGVDLLLCIGCLVVSIADAQRIDTRIAVLHRFDGTDERCELLDIAAEGDITPIGLDCPLHQRVLAQLGVLDHADDASCTITVETGCGFEAALWAVGLRRCVTLCQAEV